jgi:NAD-dependent DNA ligase
MAESMMGKCFAITGAVAGLPRKQIVEAIKAGGGRISERVYRGDVDVLIVCEALKPNGRESNKLRQAKKRGTTLLDFDQFAARYGIPCSRPLLSPLERGSETTLADSADPEIIL